MKELHFQIILLFLITFVLISISFGSFAFFSSLILLFLFTFAYGKKEYKIFVLLFAFFSLIVFYISTTRSFTAFITFTPVILVSFIIVLIIYIIYRFHSTYVYGTVITYDEKTGYGVVNVHFDFVSGVKPGIYAVKSKKRLKKGQKVKIKVKFKLFSLPEMIVE